jgi:hypothetical protein
VPDLQCASLGRVLINGAETCTGQNLPQNVCSRDLDPDQGAMTRMQSMRP